MNHDLAQKTHEVVEFQTTSYGVHIKVLKYILTKRNNLKAFKYKQGTTILNLLLLLPKKVKHSKNDMTHIQHFKTKS